MDPTKTEGTEYFHRVVDCQWACPAHTDVPEYIRLIAQGRFSDAYMLNRQSNVFPGILGRVCDRPCEPACRRERVEDKAVAICRLKRVAADNREDIRDRLPHAPRAGNGKRIALVGAGCASLTVANDLIPLGYECVIFEALDTPGGLMRTNIPAFRLPASVLDEEIAYIVDMGVDLRLSHPIESMRALLEENFDAVFVGSGAPKGKELRLPGRDDTDRIHIGIQWLESIAFGHVSSVGERVLIIGVGNTAMDCCRSSLRLGAKDVKVMARKPRAFFKASDWELEDAEEERVEIVVNHSPKAFLIEEGKLVGMKFDVVEYEFDDRGAIRDSRIVDEGHVPLRRCRARDRSGERLPVGRARHRYRFRQVGRADRRRDDLRIDPEGCLFRRRRRVRAEEHHLGRRARPSGRDFHPQVTCEGLSLTDRLPRGVNLTTAKMGIHEWSYSNDYDPAGRRIMPHVDLRKRFRKLNIEVELGFTADDAAQEVERCLNCDLQTVFAADLCIECDACIDICPVDCLTITHNGDADTIEANLRTARLNAEQALYVSGPLKHTSRVMVKDENLCVHCGLCAERCPTGAWDMQKSTVVIPYASDEALRDQQLCQTTRKAG